MKLTASDLIKILQTFDPESPVVFSMLCDGCGDKEGMSVEEVRYVLDSNIAYVKFKPLPGYKSCRQAAYTREQDVKYWKENEK